MVYLASNGAFRISANTKGKDLLANVWVCEMSVAGSGCSLGTILHKLSGNAASPPEIHLKSASARQAEQKEQESEESAVLRAAQKLAQQTPLKEEQILDSTTDSTDAQAAVVVGNVTDNDEISRAIRLDTANKEDDQ